MSEVQVTVVGYVGTDVDYREGNGTGARARFRVGSTPRFFDQGRGTWRDLETVWVTVKAWRGLAQNVASSVRKGEPVVVVGKLRTESWTDAETGETRRREVIDATAVGHDLSRGTSAYLRRSQPTVERTAGTETPDDVIARLERESGSAAAVAAAGATAGGPPSG